MGGLTTACSETAWAPTFGRRLWCRRWQGREDIAQLLRTPFQLLPFTRSLPNLSTLGTGSVYDGGHYTSALPTTRSLPNLSTLGTGSVYDGGHYTGALPTTRSLPNLSTLGTGSVYDRGHYGRTMPTVNP